MRLDPATVRIRTPALVLMALAVAWPALGAPPTVESVAPGVGRRGEEFAIVLTGGRLQDAQELIFAGEGLACRKIEVTSENEAKAVLSASADCPPGPHAFRVRTPGGVSEWKVVHVTNLPVVAEAGGRDGKAPQAIPLGSTVAGVIDSGETDAYSVELEKGGRLAAEVQAIRLGNEMTDAVLTIVGPDGRELARVDDTPMTRQDPFAALVAPESGRYTILVRDAGHGGGPNNTYALHVGDFPRPSALFPPGVQAGRPARLTLFEGAGRTPREAEVDVPGDVSGWWDYHPTIDGKAAPTPSPLRVRPYRGVAEPDLRETAAPDPARLEVHDWPIAFHGVVAGPGDRDAFAFRARRGESIQVEVFAERLGSLLDSILEVYGPDGEPVGRSDDDETHDSRLVVRARADGVYRVEVRDRRREGSPAHHYRIEVEAPTTGLALFPAGPARKSQARQAIAVPRGNRVLAHLGVRRDGFDGPVDLRVGPLPEGVTMDVQAIRAGEYLAPIVIEAAADAPLGARLVEVRGMGDAPGGAVEGGVRQVVDLVQGSGDSSYLSTVVDRLTVVVVEPAPYRVTLSPPSTPLAKDGAIDLLATVERAAGFDEPIEVSLPYLPPGVEMEGPAVVPPGQSAANLSIAARPDADPTSWRLAAEARPAPPSRDRREMTLALMGQLADPAPRRRRAPSEGMPQVASPFVALDLATPKVAGAIEPATAEQGSRARVVCRLESADPLPAGLTAALEGLPPRAEAAPVALGPGDREVAFVVSVAATTPAGEHDGLVCRLSGEVGGRAVAYRVGRGGRLKVTAPGAVAVDEEGRPLSPLDALRRRERAPRERDGKP